MTRSLRDHGVRRVLTASSRSSSVCAKLREAVERQDRRVPLQACAPRGTSRRRSRRRRGDPRAPGPLSPDEPRSSSESERKRRINAARSMSMALGVTSDSSGAETGESRRGSTRPDDLPIPRTGPVNASRDIGLAQSLNEAVLLALADLDRSQRERAIEQAARGGRPRAARRAHLRPTTRSGATPRWKRSARAGGAASPPWCARSTIPTPRS